jgi:sulfate/thiosulfate transport system permease protein
MTATQVVGQSDESTKDATSTGGVLAGVSPRGQRLGAVSGTGLGIAVLWLSLLVLIPLAAVVARSSGAGWGGLLDVFTSRGPRSALILTVSSALIVAVVNAVMGTLVAWVLVRDQFWGKRVLEVIIDIPFALPTIVAGVVLLALYGSPTSPLGINLFGTRWGILIALLFVTLPFVVRTVQPVLLALEVDVEQAAASLGAQPITIFRRIVLPAIAPAIASGTALAFARAMGEYGSVILISGNLQFKTQVASSYIYAQIENSELSDASATATVLLVISLIVLAALELIQRRSARRG